MVSWPDQTALCFEAPVDSLLFLVPKEEAITIVNLLMENIQDDETRRSTAWMFLFWECMVTEDRSAAWAQYRTFVRHLQPRQIDHLVGRLQTRLNGFPTNQHLRLNELLRAEIRQAGHAALAGAPLSAGGTPFEDIYVSVHHGDKSTSSGNGITVESPESTAKAAAVNDDQGNGQGAPIDALTRTFAQANLREGAGSGSASQVAFPDRTSGIFIESSSESAQDSNPQI
jgi:hypothetical protein